MDKLEKWFEPFKKYDKLTFKEAQSSYIVALSIEDIEKQNKAIDDIAIKTMYVIYNYIKHNNIKMFKSPIYDIEDIINSLCEQWILCIRNGDLLLKDSFSAILNPTLVQNAMKKVIGEEKDENDQYLYRKGEFVLWMKKYIELKNENEYADITFEEFMQILDIDIRNFTNADLYYVLSLYETVKSTYNILKENSSLKIDLGKLKIETYGSLLMNMGIYENITSNVPSHDDFENIIVEKEFLEEFMKVVERYPLSDRDRDILYKRFGINGLGPKTLRKIANDYNIVSSESIRMTQNKILMKLRRNYSVRRFKNYL